MYEDIMMKGNMHINKVNKIILTKILTSKRKMII